MIIKGKKTILRAIEQKDFQLLLDLINDPETEYMLGGWSFPISQQMQMDWISSQKNDVKTLRCIIESIEDNISIGSVTLTDIDYKNGNAEAHIKISDNGQRGKGYGFDAITTIIDYAFTELRLTCIYARISTHNAASLKLFTKCGFEKEGILRKRVFKRGQYMDVTILSILNLS